MGQKNIVLKTYMNKPERIQSVLEYYTKEIPPGNWASRCEEESGFYPVVNSKRVITHRERDILKRVKTDSGSYLLGIENQEKINLIFPWRLMQMDCLTYERQIEEIQERNKRKYKEQNVKYDQNDDYLYKFYQKDRLEPIINLVLYWGKKPWKTPKGLRDMTSTTHMSQGMQQMFENYKIHLISMREIPDEDIEAMKAVLEYRNTENGEEEADMCKALDMIAKEAEERGNKIGIEQGIEQGIEVFILDHQEDGTPKARVLEKLIRRFGLSSERAEGYLLKYNYV